MATTTPRKFADLFAGVHFYSAGKCSDRFVKLSHPIANQFGAGQEYNAVNGGGCLVRFEPDEKVFAIEEPRRREAPRRLQPSKALGNVTGLAFGFAENLDAMNEEATRASKTWANLGRIGGQREDAAAQLLANLAPHVERIRRWAEIVGQQLADMSADPYAFENSEAATVA